MEFILQRYSCVLENGGSTQGILVEKSPEAKFFSHVLEDEFRKVIVRGETRIPAGRYEMIIHKNITPKTAIYRGLKGFEWFEFFIEIIGIPNFGLVFIHNGNGEKDTDGCLLLNDTMGNNVIDGALPPGSRSNQAMKRFYAQVYPILQAGTKCYIDIRDENKLL